jgi:hypothetical protein
MKWLARLQQLDEQKTPEAVKVPAPIRQADPVDFVGQAPPVEISAADQVLIDCFFTATLPTVPCDLDCARRVLDPEKFFAAIRREIDGRQSSPRWKCGATQFDLELLKNLFGGQETSS